MATKVPDVSFEKMEPQPVIIWQVTSVERAIRKHPCRNCCDDLSARADILAYFAEVEAECFGRIEMVGGRCERAIFD